MADRPVVSGRDDLIGRRVNNDGPNWCLASCSRGLRLTHRRPHKRYIAILTHIRAVGRAKPGVKP